MGNNKEMQSVDKILLEQFVWLCRGHLSLHGRTCPFIILQTMSSVWPAIQFSSCKEGRCEGDKIGTGEAGWQPIRWSSWEMMQVWNRVGETVGMRGRSKWNTQRRLSWQDLTTDWVGARSQWVESDSQIFSLGTYLFSGTNSWENFKFLILFPL